MGYYEKREEIAIAVIGDVYQAQAKAMLMATRRALTENDKNVAGKIFKELSEVDLPESAANEAVKVAEALMERLKPMRD